MPIEDSGQFFRLPATAAFPSKIAATHIELLLRSPYSYFAKKLLRLRSLGRFCRSPSQRKFGSLLHEVVNLYTRSYCAASYKAQAERFVELAYSLSKDDPWLRRICIESIAEEFVRFDEGRRETGALVFSEVEGQMPLHVEGKEFLVTCIADRIEVLPKAQAVWILDYKTGVLPKACDVQSGLSPQLIIAGMIAMAWGFPCVRGPVAPSIAYVKASCRSPHWTLKHMVLKNSFEEHRAALQKLLSYYLKAGSAFNVCPAAPSYTEYDEYKHLSRLEPLLF